MLTASHCPRPIAYTSDGPFPGRAARGSVDPRKMACPPLLRAILPVQGHQRAHPPRVAIGFAAVWELEQIR